MDSTKEYFISNRSTSFPVTSKHDIKSGLEALFFFDKDKERKRAIRVTSKDAGWCGVVPTKSNDWDGVYFVPNGYGLARDHFGREMTSAKSIKVFIFDGVLYSKKEHLLDYLDHCGFEFSDFFNPLDY